MEDEIQDKLDEIYNDKVNLIIKKGKFPSIYEITIKLKDCNQDLCILYHYERFITLDANIQNLCDKIDLTIAKSYKRVE